MFYTKKKKNTFILANLDVSFLAVSQSFFTLPEDFTFVHILWLVFYLLLTGFLIYFAIKKKREADFSKIKTKNPEFIRKIFETAIDKQMKLEAAFIEEGQPPVWNITAKVMSLHKKYVILQTNLILEGAVDTHNRVYYTKEMLKLPFMGRFGMRRGLRFIYNQFETRCTLHNKKDANSILIKMYLPTSFEEIERREFPRVQVQEESLRTFVLWNSPISGKLLTNPPSIRDAVYVHTNEPLKPLFRIDDISATGIKIVMAKKAVDERKLMLMGKYPCLMLLSLVRKSSNEPLNIWLMLEQKYDGLLRSPAMLGCGFIAWANHPAKGCDFDWNTLDLGREVPPLTKWVAEELFLLDKIRKRILFD